MSHKSTSYTIKSGVESRLKALNICGYSWGQAGMLYFQIASRPFSKDEVNTGVYTGMHTDEKWVPMSTVKSPAKLVMFFLNGHIVDDKGQDTRYYQKSQISNLKEFMELADVSEFQKRIKSQFKEFVIDGILDKRKKVRIEELCKEFRSDVLGFANRYKLNKEEVLQLIEETAEIIRVEEVMNN